MKTFSKYLPGLVLLSVLILDSAVLNAESPAQASDPAAEVEAIVATHVAEQLRMALAEPRAPRPRRLPAVEVIDTTHVVVEASRLPPLDEHTVRTAQAGF